MKTLYESLLDDFDTLNSKADEGMSKYKKLAGCLDGHVSNGMKFSLGPSYYSISEYSKYLKSQFKNNYTEIKDKSGKKLNPQICGNIVSIIASQVKIDWSLEINERIHKALNDFKVKFEELIPQRIKDYADIESPAYKDAIKQLFDDGYYRDNRRHLYSESIDTDDFEVYVFDKSNANLRKGVIGQICIVYGISDTYVKKGKRLIKKPYQGMYGQHATDFNKTYWDLNPAQKRDHMGIYTLSIYDSSMIAQ